MYVFHVYDKSGFTTAAAMYIGLSQLKNGFGFNVAVPQTGQTGYDYNYQVMQWYGTHTQEFINVFLFFFFSFFFPIPGLWIIGVVYTLKRMHPKFLMVVVLLACPTRTTSPYISASVCSFHWLSCRCSATVSNRPLRGRRVCCSMYGR